MLVLPNQPSALYLLHRSPTVDGQLKGKNMNTEQLTKEDLAGFTGTEQWYRHPVVKNTLYTDGIKYVAQKAGATGSLMKLHFSSIIPESKMRNFRFGLLKSILKDLLLDLPAMMVTTAYYSRNQLDTPTFR